MIKIIIQVFDEEKEVGKIAALSFKSARGVLDVFERGIKTGLCLRCGGSIELLSERDICMQCFDDQKEKNENGNYGDSMEEEMTRQDIFRASKEDIV